MIARLVLLSILLPGCGIQWYVGTKPPPPPAAAKDERLREASNEEFAKIRAALKELHQRLSAIEPTK